MSQPLRLSGACLSCDGPATVLSSGKILCNACHQWSSRCLCDGKDVEHSDDPEEPMDMSGSTRGADR